ncbi:hypothetical protein G6F55_009700 [Rhizopus delemar]|uniref:Ras-GEF domain-containing protein n=2 Tax=Rhizopus TaxID=4842 RepID=A0A9P6YSQ5_9FUNG|nr:hypothetical protein G6F55_009700 [Rhizopus delemar]KAG1547921.1 hypothetical protein G6F51_003970 [Rhizopus arrhizus]KAG1493994.1 hypothetical protein G6F54_008193 [Rhizopus delemar]KAG1512923.1 hypothetical protein G6F53_004815 [Rhizopus delemar]KAG1563793.1 hypothetical protein G6F50_011655 [Rhizopus delemar]
MERAALATVFGVREYTESKIFWNHDTTSTIESTKPTETPCSLPSIPKVSEFGDIWQETNTNALEKQDKMPSDLSSYPTIIFDIIKSDDAPFISWQKVLKNQQHETKKRSRWSTELFLKRQEQVLKEEPQKEIEAATIEKLVEKLTSSLDYAFMTDFFLIYRIFLTPIQLIKYLILRYKWSLEKEEEERYIARIRTFVVIRHWLLNYFLHDFVPDKELRVILTKFLNEMSLNPIVRQSQRDQRIIQTLKRVVQRLKKIYYTSSSQVQVIEPPPPTFEQERVKAKIKDSLSKSALRQRFHGIHVDARHGANTAIRDQRTAPVLVIGSPRYNLSFHSSTPNYQKSLQNRSISSLPIHVANHEEEEDDGDNTSCTSFESYLTPGNSDVEQDEKETIDEELNQELNEIDISHDRPPSATSLPLPQQKKFEDARKSHSFYNAQLAIQIVTTPSSESTNSSLDYPTNDCFQPRIDMLKRQEEHKKGLMYIDRMNKPLPALIVDSSPEPSIQSDSSFNYPSSSEQWKMSIKNRHSDKSLKSRIVEVDIPLNHITPVPTSSLKPVYQSILLNYPTSFIAEKFCLIEKNILLEINWEELVDVRWTKMPAGQCLQYEFPKDSRLEENSSNTEHSIPLPGIYSRTKRMKQQQEREQDGSERGIEKAIHRFNAVCQWVSSEIVQTNPIDARVKLIEKFIRLAKKCKKYCNFSTLIQILLGLQSSSVSRLTKTWSMVNKREMRTLRRLSTFTSPTKNWKHLRDSMTQVAEEYGESPTEIQVEKLGKSTMTIKLPFGGCIPFLGIYLSDLVFNSELPPYLAPSYKPNNYHNQIETTVLSQPLVNFRKHRITASIIKKVLIFQGLAKRYPFIRSANDVLYSTCLHVVSLDTNEIQEQSHQIEP